jgi:tRNA-dihydrouridine synthase B
MQEAGADILILHPRTTRQMFSGLSAWEHIRELKANVFIPVIGNGDIKSREDGLRMLKETECDGIMIGRGAVGNPWLFAMVKRNPRTKDEIAINNRLKHFTIMTQIKYALEDKPERIVAKEMKSQIHQYIKGIPGGAKIRERINHTSNLAELTALLKEAFV